MGRILGIDYGSRRFGLALSDPLKLTAQPFANWSEATEESVVSKIASLIQQHSVELVVVGYPLTLKGQKSRLTSAVERFVSRLVKTVSVPVIFWDERFTSVQAHRIIHDMGKKPGRHKGKVDVLAAVLMLQNYLDYLREKIQ